MKEEMNSGACVLGSPHPWCPPSPRTHVARGVALSSAQEHHPHHLAVAHLRCDPQRRRAVLPGERVGPSGHAGPRTPRCPRMVTFARVLPGLAFGSARTPWVIASIQCLACNNRTRYGSSFDHRVWCRTSWNTAWEAVELHPTADKPREKPACLYCP